MKRARKLVQGVGLTAVAIAVLTQCSTTTDGTAQKAASSGASEPSSSTTRTTTTSTTTTTSRASTPPPSPTSSAPSTSTPAGTGEPIDRAAVEAWLGEWVGDVEQADAPPYSVRITLEHDGRTVVGTADYPDIGCTGRLDDADLDDGVLEIQETIPPEQTDACFSTELELTLVPDEILYHFDDGGGGDAVLRRP